MWRQPVLLLQRRITAPFAQVAGQGSLQTGATTMPLEGNTAYAGIQQPVGRRTFMGVRRSGSAAAYLGMYYAIGYAPPLHHLLHPTTPQNARRLGLEMRDTVYCLNSAGLNEYAWGFIGSVGTSYPTGLVGIGFRWSSDYSIKTFVREGTAAPTTSVREVATGRLASSPRQLMLRINGYLRQIEWYIDNELVDSYIPPAALGQMSSTLTDKNIDPRFRAYVPLNGDASIYGVGEGEGTPLLSLVDFAPSAPLGPLGIASEWSGADPARP